jgi:hypothetical protein
MKRNLKADDTEEISEDEIETKKKKVKKLGNNNIAFEDMEEIEFILLDLKNFEELNRFKNMKSLTLSTQNIKSIEVINQ